MTQASVGFHCPECTQAGRQRVVRGPVVFDPIVTKVLVAANVVITGAALVAGGSFGGLTGSVLADWALVGPLVDSGETYRIFTSAFLHDGVFHIGFNMWALWAIGQHLERIFGAPRYVGLYLVSLLGGAFGVLLLDPVSFTVGASGAVFGLFGAAAVVQRSAGFSLWDSGLGLVLGLNLLITFAVPQISIGGHLGGLVAGTVLALAYVPLARTRQPEWLSIALAALMAVALLSGSLWAASRWFDPLF